MARSLQSRLKVTVNLVAKTPLHIGGTDEGALSDLPLAVNGAGQYYIPGTGLAGAFRAWMLGLQGSDQAWVNQLWGFQSESPPNQSGDDGIASFILIEDAVIDSSVTVEIRDHVTINPDTESAENQGKFDRMILPKGTLIPLDMTVEFSQTISEVQQQKNRSAVGMLLESLKDGEIRLGAAKTRGLGQVKFEGTPIITEEAINTGIGMVKALQDLQTRDRNPSIDVSKLKSPTLNLKKLQRKHPSSPEDLQLPSKVFATIHWKPQGPLMVKSAFEGSAVDGLPLTSQRKLDKLSFVLPGSSIKGSLRTQAVRIMQTLLTPVTDSESQPENSGLSLIHHLFGQAANRKDKEVQGRVGALSIDDCYSTTSVARDKWTQVISAQEVTELTSYLDQAQVGKVMQQGFHVAIDRWTGGASPSALYSNLEPMKIEWEPITMALNLTQLTQELSLLQPEIFEGAAFALLLLLIQDLACDRIPLGYGTNRGMGAVTITNVELRCSHGIAGVKDIKPISLKDGRFNNLPESLSQKLGQDWTEFLKTVGVHCA